MFHTFLLIILRLTILMFRVFIRLWSNESGLSVLNGDVEQPLSTTIMTRLLSTNYTVLIRL